MHIVATRCSCNVQNIFRFERFKASYSVLHKTVAKRNKGGLELDKTIKGMNQTLLAEKIKLERQNIARLEEDQVVTTLIREKEQVCLHSYVLMCTYFRLYGHALL